MCIRDRHWYQYTYEQHYTNVNPVFVIQVCAGSGKKVSDTDLDDVIAKIEERMCETFKEHEVVHTFGSTGSLMIHGLNVPHVEPVSYTHLDVYKRQDLQAKKEESEKEKSSKPKTKTSRKKQKKQKKEESR